MKPGWALARDPSIRGDLARVFAEAERFVARGPNVGGTGNEALLRAHGILDDETRSRIALDALAHVVRPCASALLARTRDAFIDEAVR